MNPWQKLTVRVQVAEQPGRHPPIGRVSRKQNHYVTQTR